MCSREEHYSLEGRSLHIGAKLVVRSEPYVTLAHIPQNMCLHLCTSCCGEASASIRHRSLVGVCVDTARVRWFWASSKVFGDFVSREWIRVNAILKRESIKRKAETVRKEHCLIFYSTPLKSKHNGLAVAEVCYVWVGSLGRAR